MKETLTLYFADKDGTGLEKQTRVIHYSSNIALEKLVVEQLIEGPKGSKLKATLPGTTKLINVSVADRICYLNFDSSFRNTIDNKLTEDVVLYSIVNSLTSLPTVDKVQISLDGENDGMLLYNYKLSDMYEFNKDIVDSNDSTEKTENRIDWIRRRRVLVKDRCFYLRWSILQELFSVCMAGALGFCSLPYCL